MLRAAAYASWDTLEAGLEQMCQAATDRHPPFILAPGVDWPERLGYVPTPDVWPPGAHSNYEMAYLDYGECAVVLDGAAFRLQPGNFCIVEPRLLHYEAPVHCGVAYRLFWFAVRPSRLSLFAAEYQSKGCFRVLGGVHATTEHSLTPILDALCQAVRSRSLFSEALQRGYLLTFLGQVGRQLELERLREPSPQAALGDGIIQETIQFIADHYADFSLSVVDLANRVFLSPSYFSVYFRSRTGYSPYQYLLKVRMERAQALLSQTDWTIDRISESVGFGSPYHFSRMFRRMKSVSPSEFRRQAQGQLRHAPSTHRPELNRQSRPVAN